MSALSDMPCIQAVTCGDRRQAGRQAAMQSLTDFSLQGQVAAAGTQAHTQDASSDEGLAL
jgi:hypothetical protein